MSVTVYVTIAAVLGLCVLLLVTRELSRKRGPSRPGHIALAALMGFGVVGLSVKAFALVMLNSNPRLTDAAEASRTIAPSSKEHAELSDVRGIRYPSRGGPWQALPERPQRRSPGARQAADTPEMIELGRRLFFDPRLSSSGTVACASCHDIAGGGDDGHSVSTGIEGLKGGRNAPTVLNAAYLTRLFWDGRAKSLEDQAVGPLMNPVEMGLSSADEAVAIVNMNSDYVQRFQAVFGTPVSIDAIAQAIAAFERTLITPDAPYDRFVRGDDRAVTPQQLRGMRLFDEIGCRRCHQDPVFSVAGETTAGPYRPFPVFKNAPLVDKHALRDDRGRNANGVWRVPSLRNVELTAPYFHNGSVDNLEDAVRVMATAQLGRTLSNAPEDSVKIVRDAQGRPVRFERLALSDRDVADIAAFLRALTGSLPKVSALGIRAADGGN